MRFSLPAVSLIFLAAVAGLLLLISPKPWDLVAKDPEFLKLRTYSGVYSWYAGAINIFLLAALAATSRWWAAPLKTSFPPSWLPVIKTPRWFWPLVAVAMTLTAITGGMRLGQSLWDDEDTSARNYIHGEWRIKNGELSFKKATWQDAFFNYRKPSNHHLQTHLSKIFHDSWKTLTRPEGLQMSEAVMRFPVLLAGSGSVATTALLLLRLGFPGAGVITAFLLALHPWHLRYASELRGYGFSLLLLPLLIYLLLLALEKRTWKHWTLFGTCQLLLLYAHSSTLFAVLVLNILGIAAAMLRNRGTEPWWAQPSRLVVAGVFGAMVFLQLMLPCVPQFRKYLETDVASGVLTPRWHNNLAAHFLSGIPWNNSDAPKAGFPELQWIYESAPWLHSGFYLVLAALLLIGLFRLLLARPCGWLVTAVFTVPPALLYLSAKLRGTYLYEWYLISALPGFLALCALGLALLCGRIALRRSWAGPALAVSAVVIFGLFTQPARSWFLNNPLQQMRESVLLIRPSLDPFHQGQKDILTAKLNAPVRSYDAFAVGIGTREEFLAMLQQAETSGLPLFVNYGNFHAAASNNPQIHAWIEDDRLFEKTATLPGYDPTLDRFIRKYIPGAMKDFPFDSPPGAAP